MATLELIPWTGPNADYTSEPTVKVLKTEFGDGYIQRAPDGINNVRYSHQLSWTGPKDKVDLIERFLAARLGAETFAWQAPSLAGAVGYFVCEKWSRSRLSPQIHTLQVTFDEVFAP